MSVSFEIPPVPPIPSQGSHPKWEDTFCFQHCRNCISHACSLSSFSQLPAQKVSVNSLEHCGDVGVESKTASCPLVDCFNFCGARMHQCKLQPHVEDICPLARVPCLSSHYGCVAIMPRYLQGVHLAHCPASIVHCTLEWNRWPRFPCEKQPSLELQLSRFSALKNINTGPHHTENLPLLDMNRNNNHTCADKLELSATCSVSNGPLGGACSDPLNTLCTSQFDLALAINDQETLEAGMRVSKHTRRALRNSLTQRFPAMPMIPNCHHRCGSEPVCSSCSNHSTTSGVSQMEDSDPPGLSSTVCSRLFGQPTSPSRSPAIGAIGSSVSANQNRDSLRLDSFSATEREAGDHVIVEKTEDASSLADTPLAEVMAWAVNERSLQVDCLMEFFPRYQHKPRAIYTFLCPHDVKRSEFPDHYKMHCDVHCQVDGWIEQRCPLAYRGCSFAFHRLQPNQSDAQLVYSSQLSAFSFRYNIPSLLDTPKSSPLTTSDSSPSCPVHPDSSPSTPLIITDLPNELLIKIAVRVDNFSLHQLARTCTRFADICAYLLPTRGAVSIVWHRVRKEPSRLVSWVSLDSPVWFFTTGSSHVARWCFAQDSLVAMQRHLAVCPFYDPVINTEPYTFTPEFPFKWPWASQNR